MTKIIVECERCKHQYKLHEKRVGEKFHCFCGSLLTVPSVKIHDAAVVRCSSCGGARGKDAEPFCRYCGSSFTIHERDLNTICPHCMTRISSKAKFCHSCSTPIASGTEDFLDTDMDCPVCDDHKLHSRQMQSQSFNLKECSHCAGLWISADVFQHLERKTKREAVSGILAGVSETKIQTEKSDQRRHQNPAKYYRKCPQCLIVMNRKNYARSSDIIIDVCNKHGMWFDIHELDEILEFIRSGDLLKQQEKAARKAKRSSKRNNAQPAQIVHRQSRTNNVTTSVDIFSEIIDWLID